MVTEPSIEPCQLSHLGLEASKLINRRKTQPRGFITSATRVSCTRSSLFSGTGLTGLRRCMRAPDRLRVTARPICIMGITFQIPLYFISRIAQKFNTDFGMQASNCQLGIYLAFWGCGSHITYKMQPFANSACLVPSEDFRSSLEPRHKGLEGQHTTVHPNLDIKKSTWSLFHKERGKETNQKGKSSEVSPPEKDRSRTKLRKLPYSTRTYHIGTYLTYRLFNTELCFCQLKALTMSCLWKRDEVGNDLEQGYANGLKVTYIRILMRLDASSDW
ncbi:hypothetical protein B0H65DRAFT_14119 [Neurospora tetraspora]|uniref:Uncharacterized protein n=1 Tax=Neurospora tetraspora TaxID=94610 RepID=A0AAE0MW63_9PEZI|nr:hypothetical protein B0H65DRAFT_14119 [Neurospora tetraspora]